MASSTVENYVKQLYLEQRESAGEMVPTGRLAAAMRVVPGTATSMVKALSDAKLVEYEPRGGVRLTPAGEHLALHVLRRHRLVELFLVKTLGLDWSEVHAEAEELEHAISEKVLDRIDRLLGHPSVDPHGDPIPTAKGKVVDANLQTLGGAPLNTPLRIARVVDQEAPFLQFLDRAGLVPGAAIILQSRDPLAEAVRVRVESRAALTLGLTAATKILVEPA